jgi:hypothetical protein
VKYELVRVKALRLWHRVTPGTTEEIPLVFAPYGNKEATPEQPHFTGTVRFTRLGNPRFAGADGAWWTFNREARKAIRKMYRRYGK